MTDCQHENFWADVAVNRLSTEEGGPVNRFEADIKIRCVDCGEDFVFIGLPTGLSPRHPAVSLDATELRCPVRPQSAPEGWGESGAGFSVTYTGPEPASDN